VAYVPIYISPCKLIKEVVVTDEEKNTFEVRPTMKISATIDHRIIDGLEGSKMYKQFTAVLSDPEKYFNLEFEAKSLLGKKNNKTKIEVPVKQTKKDANEPDSPTDLKKEY